MSTHTPMSFWIKYIAGALLVIIAAIAALMYQPREGDAVASVSAEQEVEPKANISENLSKFYEQFRQSSRDPIAERYGDYVIPLPEPKRTASEQLATMGSVSFPPQRSWSGSEKVRSFSSESTLKTEATKYVEAEGMTLIWDLNQDFIIKARFQSFNTLIGTLDELRGAMDANFPGELQVFLCHKKRALVITQAPSDYILDECRLKS